MCINDDVPDSANPWLNLPLNGLRLIEASAGTGKTFTVATLFTRLIVEKNLQMGQILAVTFTEAATQELRKRIRERLALAAKLVIGTTSEAASTEAQLTRVLIKRQLDTESEHSLHQRLQRAAEETDLAAIFTIHGFCTRVLREYALESGHTLANSELITDVQPVYTEIATDIWRRYSAQTDYLETLTGLWKTPEALAAVIPKLISELPLHPPCPDADTLLPDPSAKRDAAASTLITAIHTHLAAAKSSFEAAYADNIMNNSKARRSSIESAFIELEKGCAKRYWAYGKSTQHVNKLSTNYLATACKKGKLPPTSPLFDALQDWLDVDARCRAFLNQQKIILLHHIRQQVSAQFAQYKQQYRRHTHDDVIHDVAHALCGERGKWLADKLRAQYHVALVDEFQDTDARQWDIFKTVFADNENEAALFLIGDPKQAIYGFRGGDIDTYLQAKTQAQSAPPLNQNFRSRPAVLRAIDTLYELAGEAAFGSAAIQFEPLLPGGNRTDTDYLHHNQPAPALKLCWIENEKPLLADPSREAVTAACVADIYQVLLQAQQGKVQRNGQAIGSGDIAVLVRSRKEGARIQRALQQVGIAAVAAGQQSIFATEQAQEIRLLLLALLHPHDPARLRAALSTVLLGYDAATIASLDHDEALQHEAHTRLLQWRARWQRSGIFTVITDICAQHAPCLLGLIDGERRLSNSLQLAQALQQASTANLGPQGLLEWLQLRIARANDQDDEQQLHLESDARCVQIITLHKSKGLEYPLVYLPFVGIETQSRKNNDFEILHNGQQRVIYWKIDSADETWQQVSEAVKVQDRNETARLLYVGLTRARDALWLAGGALTGADKSPLAAMLKPLQDLKKCSDIQLYTADRAAPLPPRLPPEQDISITPPRAVQRRLAQDWWVYSFTQLAHAEGRHEQRSARLSQTDTGAADEQLATLSNTEEETPVSRPQPDNSAPLSVAQTPLFSGARFGNVLHGALEVTDFAAWRGWRPGEAAPDSQRDHLLRALDQCGYQSTDITAGLDVATQLTGHTLTVTLPEGGTLCDLPGDQRRAEIEFHFSIQPVAVANLLRLLHAHGIVRQRQHFGQRRQLEGLMTGKIDLTYTYNGRWYVLDYKTNQLPDYQPLHLAVAMQHSEYELQALIYTLALHRWLGFRLGNTYDYARDFGGIRYLFCRGLDARRHPSPGIYAHCFTPELIHALDHLFAGRADFQS